MNKPNRTKVTTEMEESQWDVIVIGSGIAGMTSALGLADAGKKVLLLEQHIVPGGYATCFKRKNFTFDVSLHAMPALKEGKLMHEILSDLGVMQRITPIPLSETMVIKTQIGSFTMGANFLDQLRESFPEEKKAIDKVDRLIETIITEMGKLIKFSFLPDPIYTLIGFFVAPLLYRFRRKTLNDVLDELTDKKALKQLIAVQWGYFGLPLSKISASLYFAGWGGFIKEGIYYIKGTSQALSNAFIDRLEEEGGQLVLKQHVEKILIENGKVAGVVSKDVTKGKTAETHTFRAPVVISNANPFSTFGEMLSGNPDAAAYMKKFEKMELSTSATVLFIGLDCRLSDLCGEDYHSVAFLDDDLNTDMDFKKAKEGRSEGFSGLTDYSRMDPDLAPEGKSCLAVIMTDFMKNWKDLDDEAYQLKKASEVERIINSLEERYPGFREHIEVVDAGTPRTMKRYTLNHEGVFNGFAYSTDRVRMGKGKIGIKTPIPGLYQSSAWVDALSGGYYGCIINGMMTSKLVDKSEKFRSR